MNDVALVATLSIVMSAVTITAGTAAPAIGEARALVQALAAIAQQPDEANSISRTLFVGLALVESTAIYCLVVAMILIFVNPFWNYVIGQAGG